MSQAGLEPTRMDLIPKDMKHQGPKVWLDPHHLVALLDRVPIGDREALVGQFAEEYPKKYPADSEGLVHVEMVRFEVKAVKPL